jgi:hypothetical protein
MNAEDQGSSHAQAPMLEAALERAQLAVWIHSRTLALKTLEELEPGQVWIHIQPGAYLTPTGFEGIDARSPMPGSFCHRLMSWTYLAGMPGRRQTRKETR